MPLGLILSLLPQLPSLIGFVEQIHGPAAGNGATKLATLLSLIQTLVPELEAAFNVSPATKDIVSKIIAIAVAAMNASGMMPVSAIHNFPQNAPLALGAPTGQ